jgi:integrase
MEKAAMSKKTLTAASVEKIRRPSKGQAEHFDLGRPGLALRVSYAGAKSWTFFYRLGGKLHRMRLGNYPAMGLLEAREAWHVARQNVARGIDPAGHGIGRADIFETVVEEWLKRDQSKNKASTIYQTRRIVDVELLPAWGQRPVDTIVRRDVIELLDKIADRGAPVQARRIHAHLHRFFNWCVGRGIITANPVSGVEKLGANVARERVLIDAEIVAVWKACEHGPYSAAMRLLLLTGARKEEISRLKWSEIDSDTIKLDGGRTKNGKPHTIPLSHAARAVLKNMVLTGDCVFSVDNGKSPITGWTHAKARIDALANIAPWRIHDLRRTVATGLQKLSVNLQTIEAVLGHVGGSRSGIVGVYQRHSFDAEKRAALEAWGAHVMALVEGRAPGKVLSIRGTRQS